MDGLTEGRMVHYVMPNGEHRPAIVVRNWATELTPPCEGYVNLTVFTDWNNDAQQLPPDFTYVPKEQIASGMFWATSVCHSENKEPGTWHWIERA